MKVTEKLREKVQVKRICLNCVHQREEKCRRYPPVYINKLGHGIWPRVYAGDTCGEFVAK